MTAGVVRQLVTRISFTFDRRNLDNFERSILGFRTRFLISAGAIGVAFNQIKKSVDEFSDNLLRIDAVSRFAKTSSQALQGLIVTFQQLGLAPEKFLSGFEKLTLEILETSRGGLTQLTDILRSSNFSIQIKDANGELRKTEDVLIDILKYFSKFEDNESLRLFTNVLGLDLKTVGVLLDNFKKNQDNIVELISINTSNIKGIEEQTEAAKQYNNALNSISASWIIIKNTIGSIVLPPVVELLESFAKDLSRISEFGFFHRFNPQSPTNESFVNSMKPEIDSAMETFRALTSLRDETFPKLTKLQNELAELHREEINTTNAVSGNYNFEFNVAPGTTLEQSQAMADNVRAAMSGFLDEKIRDIINNNPQVE
jgi:hypothetical protein